MGNQPFYCNHSDMGSKYLVLLPATAILALSCHKDHNNSINPNHPTSDTSLTLATAVVTSITDTTAVSGGSFTAVGSAIVIHYKGVEWDTSVNFSNYWQWKTSSGSGTGSYASGITGLYPNTRYYVRAYAGTDSQHIWFGDTLLFTTPYTAGKFQVSTFAGTGMEGAADGDVSTATFFGPVGAAVDLAGNVYIADEDEPAVRKITPAGMVSTFVHSSVRPNDVICDTAGNVYVAGNFQILKITPSGQVSAFAGSGTQGHADGTGTAATFWAAITLAIDPAGNLYVGDVASFRKITPAGVVSTLTSYLAAPNSCWVIGVDNHFNIYESDTHTLIKIDSAGNESFLAGSPQTGSADGAGAAASFGYLDEIRIDPSGNLYGTDVTNNKVRMITPGGTVSTVAGTGAVGAQDGNSAIATFNSPIGLAVDNSGNLIVCDAGNHKIRKITLH